MAFARADLTRIKDAVLFPTRICPQVRSKLMLLRSMLAEADVLGATPQKTGDKIAANITCREVEPSRIAVESQITTMLAVPCWSSWRAAMCAIQATVERNEASSVGLEMPVMKP